MEDNQDTSNEQEATDEKNAGDKLGAKEYFKREQVYSPNQLNITYSINPPIRVSSKKRWLSSSTHHYVSEIELIANCPTFKQEGQLIVKAREDDKSGVGYVLYQTNSMPDLKRSFEILDEKIKHAYTHRKLSLGVPLKAGPGLLCI